MNIDNLTPSQRWQRVLDMAKAENEAMREDFPKIGYNYGIKRQSHNGGRPTKVEETAHASRANPR